MVELNFELVQTILFTFGSLIAAVVVSEALLFILENIVKPLTAKTKTTLDDRLIDAIKTPVRLMGIIIGIYLTISPLYQNALLLDRTLEFWLGTALILWSGLLVSNLINAVIVWYYRELSEESALKSNVKVSHDFVPMLRRIVKATTYIVTIIIVLDRFGVEITPLITALGIGGLAVALALKDTLANFFAGVHLLTDKPIKVGEFISIDDERSPIKGFVEEVGWRTTRIRTRGNFTYYIPNEKITLSNIVNYSRGIENNWKGASIVVSVDYKSNVEKVKEILINAVKKTTGKNTFIASDFEPYARLEEFGDSAMIFKLFYRISTFSEAEAVAGQVREQILEDFRKNKINIPFPVRTIQLEGNNTRTTDKKK